MNITKLNDNTIEVTKTETKETLQSYDYGFLKKHRESILAQKQKDNDQRDLEIAEVDLLLAEADKLGVIEKVEELLEEIIN